jgi:DNA (cytosine-5)-methyltransferase 1
VCSSDLGIGGFSLGLESTGHFETTAFCEIDKFCKLILNKHWEGKKLYDDVKAISKKQFEEDGIELPDIITGGFPCQPFSVAGKQQGTSDSRHLWPEMFRIIKDFSPRWVIGENVKGLTNIQDGMVFETVCTDLEGEGYEVRTFNIPAAGVQAPHRRERIWIVAHAKRFNERKSIRGSDETQSRIQEEHRQNDSASRESSRTGSVWGTNNGHENLENSRRTLQQGTELSKKNENETREGNANIDQRSSGTSESDVADTNESRGGERRVSRDIGDEGRRASETRGESIQPKDRQTRTDNFGSSNSNVADTKSIGSDVGRRSEHSETWNGQREIGGENSQDDANSNEEGLQGFRQSRNQLNKRFSLRSEGSEGEHGTVGEGWWSVEPNVGRVAHGVPGRVYRLKGLGNSIVPQIVEEIGKALIKATRES